MIRCDDADLLMLAHGALEGRRALAVRLHAGLCPACRARLRRFESLSASIAGAFTNPSLGTRTFGRVPHRAWAPVGVLVALLLLLAGLAASNVADASSTPVVAARACPRDGGKKVVAKPNFCPLHRDR